MVAFAKLLPAWRQSVGDPQTESPHLRFVLGGPGGNADEAPDVIGRIDRRFFPRQQVAMRVTGRRLDHSVEARRDPCLYLSLKDVSVGGLCALSQTPLKAGERIAVFFPPEGISRGWDAYGQVLRVRPVKMGYQIGVSFDRLPAA